MESVLQFVLTPTMCNRGLNWNKAQVNFPILQCSGRGTVSTHHGRGWTRRVSGGTHTEAATGNTTVLTWQGYSTPRYKGR